MLTTARLFQVLLVFCIGSFFTNHLFAQTSLWTDIDASQIARTRTTGDEVKLNAYRALELDFDQFQKELMESLNTANGALLELPLPDGQLQTFQLKESPILPAKLGAKYPEFKTFTLQSIENPAITGRMDISPRGTHFILFGAEGTIFLEPLFKGQNRYYANYYEQEDVSMQNIEGLTNACGVVAKMENDASQELIPTNNQESLAKSRNSQEIVNLRVYRLALTNTGEYAEYHRADEKDAVLFEFGTAVNFVNAIYERDFAIRFEIIEEIEELIFLDARTDPFNVVNDVTFLFGESATVIELRVPRSKFDVGHTLTANCSTGGGAAGIASLSGVCQANRATAASCQFSRNTGIFATRIFAHELGHQFAATHSWSSCSDSGEEVTPYEPGSGSTVMSYAGLCGANNIQGDSDDYFHVANIEQVERHENSFDCASIVIVNNTVPVANILTASGLTIPISTPFELKGEGTDADTEDRLTYCWEQFDIGPTSDLNNPSRNAPTFRSLPPTESPNRICPRLDNILNNTYLTNNTEVLATYSRDFTFRLTVRDNHPEAGGVDWATLSFKADGSAGPFELLFPNSVSDLVTVGAGIDVTWDVANTDVAPVNCQKVNILLSTDGGKTYPPELALAMGVPNDGAQTVTVPDVTTRTARVKIEAADNIFFDVSNTNFDIISPTQAGFSYGSSIQSKEICLPEKIAIDLNTVSLLAYSDPIQFEVVEGLPEGATANFKETTTIPGEDNELTIDFENVQREGDFEVLIRGTAPNADTIFRKVEFHLVSNDFSALQLQEPLNNSNGVVLPTYTWAETADANTYTIEVATSPAFGNTIIDKSENLITPLFSSTLKLDPSTIYYWRVIPINECGEGPPSEIFAYQTETFNCSGESTETPIFITEQGLPTVKSTIDINQNLVISDLNVLNVKGSHNFVKDIKMSLTGPEGTTVTLIDRKCFNVPFNLGFDDEAANTDPCPPDDRLPHVPKEPLAAFDGMNAFGTWTLQIEVVSDGEGGSLDAWSLEFCSNASVDSPVLVNNNLFPLPPLKGRVITTDFLLVEDANNAAAELIYTLVAAPNSGQLLINGAALSLGMTFTQAALNGNQLTYKNVQEGPDKDSFSFTVSDGEGGWIGITPFEILLDPSETTTSTATPTLSNLVKIYPNPAQEMVYLDVNTLISTDVQLSIFDVKGRLLKERSYSNTSTFGVSVADLSVGIYLVQLKMQEGIVMKKVIVSR